MGTSTRALLLFPTGGAPRACDADNLYLSPTVLSSPQLSSPRMAKNCVGLSSRYVGPLQLVVIPGQHEVTVNASRSVCAKEHTSALRDDLDRWTGARLSVTACRQQDLVPPRVPVAPRRGCVSVRLPGGESRAAVHRVVRDTVRALHEAIVSSEDTATPCLCPGGVAPRDRAHDHAAALASGCPHRTA
jgi:hypothetical protein